MIRDIGEQAQTQSPDDTGKHDPSPFHQVLAEAGANAVTQGVTAGLTDLNNLLTQQMLYWRGQAAKAEAERSILADRCETMEAQIEGLVHAIDAAAEANANAAEAGEFVETETVAVDIEPGRHEGVRFVSSEDIPPAPEPVEVDFPSDTEPMTNPEAAEVPEEAPSILSVDERPAWMRKDGEPQGSRRGMNPDYGAKFGADG